MELITVEVAERSLTMACGAFIIVLTLIAAAAWYFTVVFVKREKQASKKREKSNVERIRKQYREELRQQGAANFVNLYDANARIKELESQLQNNKECFTALQKDYRRLKELCERVGMNHATD